MAAAIPGADAASARASGFPTPDFEGARVALQGFADRFASGDFAGALRAASDACHAAAQTPEPHYAYGQAWLAVGDARRAAEAFAAALKLRPRWADAWVNYGLARYRLNAVDDARRAMEETLEVEPTHAGALGNLGAFLRITGDAERAERILRSALAASPGNYGARLNLVADLLQEERSQEALALLDEASPPEDDARAARHWRLQKALARLQRGDAAAARNVLAELEAMGPAPAALAPLIHWRRVLLANLERDPQRARAEARLMGEALAFEAPDSMPEHRIMGHYDLAKFWSGQGDHTAAFENWRQGHRLLARFQPFSRAEHAAFIDASIAAFSRERFERGPTAGNADPRPVFVVGMPRSGTTLCEQILGAHRDAFGAGERSALAQAFRRLGGGEGPGAVMGLAALDRGALDAAAADYLAELKALAPGASRVVDKMPGNSLYLGLAGLLFPKAKIIYCARDPRDIGLSIFTFRFHGRHGYAHDLADLGWTIAEPFRLMDHWKAILPGSILTVRLDDWVHDFEGTLARVLDHVGLPPDPNCSRFYESESRVRTVSRAQVRQPVNARGLGRWRAYEKELAPLIAELKRAGRLPEAADGEAGAANPSEA